jgi:hypothetical protein
MKAILTILLIFVLASTLPYTPAAIAQSPTPENTLIVCIGAHPDDIDIAISGTLYKNDLGKHPILWIVVADGGADIDEYQYESNSSRNWITQDGKFVIAWKAPDGSNVIRPFYSVDMAKKRCGGYFEGLNWTEEPASHNSSFGVEYDWRTRVNNFVGPTVEKIQLSYINPTNATKRLTYPDGALANAETAYTNSIATSIASEITKVVEANGYQKSLIKIYSHAIEEVCTNANEHSDHKVTGNAVRQAIDLLHETYGFGQIDAKWFTIYSPINPKSGYVRVDDDISQQETQKTDLAKACWETEAVHTRSINYTWTDYPEDPGQYEYTVAQSYYAPSPSPFQAFIDGLVSLFNNIVRQYPLAVIVVAIVVIVAIAVAVRKRKAK